MEKSIRTELMESFGITKEEAVALIRTYARNHNGQVNLTQIKKDVEHIVDTMIHNVGNVYKDYDIQHELTECGKDRTQEAMRTLMGTPENEELVESYLINRYANNVGIWADTFYKAAQKKILETLDKGIESYRDLVKQLPYENINRVANTFGIELDVADFLSINGTPEDFQKFMTSTRPLRKNDDIERKGCPKDLSDKIFTELQIEDHYGTLNCFSRDGIMRGLSSIYNATGLTPEEKEKAQNLFIRDFLEHGYEEEFIRLCRTEIPQKFEVMQEYLQMSPDTPWEEKHSFFDEKVVEHLSDNSFPPFNRPKRRNKDHAGITITDNCPEDPVNKKYGKNHAGDKVSQPDIAEIICRPGITQIGHHGSSDQKTGHNHYRHAQGHCPVPNSHRGFPHINGVCSARRIDFKRDRINSHKRSS